ncbi:DUF5777 family beta-barrel protein [Mangrovibacterium sp.]|uniref:DUF5777 family beta-barrel protein n=1 Tax=Mangrovibacterium sp. TaxID=1961364 RepID=UPI00356AC41D
MKKKLLYIIISLFVCTNLWAQEKAEKDEVVMDAFASALLIDNQTSFMPSAKTLEFVIQHKFGSIQNGRSDLWGIYAPAEDIRLGLNYVPVENVQIGAGISRKLMNTDFNLKWNVLKQTTNDRIPFFVTLYGNLAIDGREKDQVDSGMTFSDRLAYFSQIIIGRKFTDALSLQTGISFSHANLVTENYDHDRVGLHLNGRMKVSPQGAIIATFDAPLQIDKLSEQASYIDQMHPEPTLSFGYEISTYTHVFSIYMGNSSSILQQNNMMNNFSKIEKDNFAIGFTITRLWMW